MLINIIEGIRICRKKLIKIVIPSLFLLSQSSCKKFVETSPPTDVITENTVFTSDATAAAVLTSIYNKMNGSPIQGTEGGSISLFTGLSADELTLFDGVSDASYLGYYKNSLTQTPTEPVSGGELWAPLYNFIFKANAAIEGLKASSGLTPEVKGQLTGEAKFVRAFFYFYLVNLFGDVPLAITTDPKVTSMLGRSSKEAVYKQIIDDLISAQQLLSESYLNGTVLAITTERVRPTKWAALALLARVYLYTENWGEAEKAASAVISNTTLFNIEPLGSVFLKDSKEAIWQIQPTVENFNTLEAQTMIITNSGPNDYSNPVFLSNHLLNAFEPNDQRIANHSWVDSITVSGQAYSYPFKYKLNLFDPDINSSTGTDNIKEYFMVLRLAEQYLIRAEARAQLSKFNEAISDLNVIRSRAGLPNSSASDKASILDAIFHERQVELFTEWGHRWFDLKRTGKINSTMDFITPQKSNGGQWNSNQQLYPIPLSELQRASNLYQNPGY